MSSKQDNARFGGNSGMEQKRNLASATQNQDSASRLQAKSKASQQKQEDLGPTQLLAEHMNAAGNPVPDTPTGKQGKDDVDFYEAMTKDFD
ncbi:hypothetical protein N7466_002482 [Penicillium verhagenii]|uniref:uncharacterized protein n=1 Tax=Penicillium verhagenii TaxID=1562060 RepID=UPI002545A675|nr:uncharacterized protein N7466_002482 [Penicillium verhagenii]KAJ5939348.1 hypothetical protein N7466_002482 [Penicillium verhagenii]